MAATVAAVAHCRHPDKLLFDTPAQYCAMLWDQCGVQPMHGSTLKTFITAQGYDIQSAYTAALA